MGVHSGKFGVVNDRKMVRNWTIEDTSTAVAAIHSGSAGGTFRQKGILDWTGTYEMWHPAIADIADIIMPGESFSFSGYTAPSDDVQGSAGTTYSGDAIVESIAITWDFAGGTPINIVTNFQSGAGGALTIAQSAPPAVETPDLPGTICGLKLEWAAAAATPSWADWDNITTATLTITSQNQEYVNSSTNCNTGRKPGIIDWSFPVTEQEEDQVVGPIGGNIGVRAYIDPTNYWLLEWGHIESYSGLTVDRETGAIIEKTANLAMSGFDSGVGTLGVISKPGVTTGAPWWGRDLGP